MSVQENPVITQFVEEYTRNFPAYTLICERARQIIDSALKRKGIMAIVTARVKDPQRLREKLHKREAGRLKDGKGPYTSAGEIHGDISDLVGARIALYFPNDAAKIEMLLPEEFEKLPVKEFPARVDNFSDLVEEGFTAYKRRVYPGYENRRFDGYRAQHHPVRFVRPVSEVVPNPVIEIQVASVLMHAWSEVEHDLAYKKKMGDVSREEYECLDEINGLVMAGEIALNRLDQLSQRRIMASDDVFTSHYALAAYLSEKLEEMTGQAGISLGDVEQLFWVWKRKREKLNRVTVDKDLKRLEYDPEEFLADQLMDLLSDTDAAMTKALVARRRSGTDGRELARVGKYIVDWISLEREVKAMLRQRGHRVGNSSDIWRIMSVDETIPARIRTEYRRLRLERNRIAHGNEFPTAKKLSQLEEEMDRFRELLQTEGI